MVSAFGLWGQQPSPGWCASVIRAGLAAACKSLSLAHNRDMTSTTRKIAELAETLSREAQEDLLRVAEHMASPASFYDRF